MRILGTSGDEELATAVTAACEALGQGRIVGIPTDTVYGLAADPSRPGATDGLFSAKKRPRGVEIPVLVSGMSQALELAAEVPERARLMMERLWPGALTIVLHRKDGVDFDLGDFAGTIALRCPDHPVPRSICETLGPLATTSANLHGEEPCTTAEQVRKCLVDVDLVVDGGTIEGRPSTLVDLTGTEPRLLREGAISWSEIKAFLS